LAPQADREEVRWQFIPNARTAAHRDRDYNAGQRMAEENRGWGYRRIQGALANLGHVLAHKTIANILKQHGIEPAPERSRKTTWKEFLSRHFDQIVASDFFTVEVWTPVGLVRYHVLFVIRLMTCEIHIAGIVPEPGQSWMKQVARNLIDATDGFLRGSRLLIHDRSTLFSEQFREILSSAGVESLRLPALFTQFECLRRTLRSQHQRVLFGQTGPDRGVGVASSHL
jgi:protein-tyrosine-phosphatase